MKFGNIKKKMEEKADKLHEERLARCVPVAQEIVKILGESRLPLGDITDEDQKEYDAASDRILQLMIERGTLFTERNFIFQLILQSWEQVKIPVIKSLEHHFDRVMEHALGKKIDEVTVQFMDETLKKDKS